MKSWSRGTVILITILVTSTIVGSITTLLVGGGVWYWQNTKLKKLQDEKKELKEEITRLKERINELKEGQSPDKFPKRQPDEFKRWEEYSNQRFSYSVKYPPGWDKTESANRDGITLTQGDQEILIYGAYDTAGDKTIKAYIDRNYPDALSVKPLTAGKNHGYQVSLREEEYLIFQNKSGDFIFINTGITAEDSTIKLMKKIAQTLKL